MNYFDIPHTDRVYLGELQTQCMFAFRAIKYCELALNQQESDLDEFWYNIQMFLTSVANVDKMLHGAKSYYKVHHQKIIKTHRLPEVDFEIERKIRNRFDHYDERIVDWIENSENHNIIISGVFPDGAIGGNFDYFKKFDPVTNKLSFGNKEFDVTETLYKLNSLDQRIQEILAL